MMKRFAVLTLAVAALAVGSQDALARQSLFDASLTNQGLFGGRSHQDGTIDLREQTSEQFNPVRGQSVAERPRPDFDPTPINIGSFQMFPSVNFGAYYDSNIYSTDVNVKDDVVWKAAPVLGVTSNWGRHAVSLIGLGDFATYSDNSTEDYIGGATQLEGRYDIADKTWADLALSYQRATEPRSSPSFLGTAAEPTQLNYYKAVGTLYRGVGRLKPKTQYEFSFFDYDPVRLVGGGQSDQSGRNRMANVVGQEFEYEVTENFRPFVRGSYDWNDYVKGATRSSHGRRADVGARMDLGGVTTGELYVGYLGRDFYNFNGGGEDVTAMNFGGSLLWNVTELTSVQSEFSRSIDETTLGGVSSFVTSGGSVTVTHELRRDVLLEAHGSYSNLDFQQSSREDDDFTVGTGARYFVNRNIHTDVTYDYDQRNSNVAGGDYERHVVLGRVGVQY